MAYFPNGTSLADWTCQWCDNCANQEQEPSPGCAVLDAHIVSTDLHRDDHPLHMLIENGGDYSCKMFRRIGEEGRHRGPSEQERKLALWLKLPCPRPAFDEWSPTMEASE